MKHTSEPHVSEFTISPDYFLSELDSADTFLRANTACVSYCGRYVNANIWWNGVEYTANVYRNGHYNRSFRAMFLHSIITTIIDHFGHE
jgi:hypothetical protein